MLGLITSVQVKSECWNYPICLDWVPLSIIFFDDWTLLINLNYFWMRDRNLVDGDNHRSQDVPVVHLESFTRQFAEWCLEKDAYAVNLASFPFLLLVLEGLTRGYHSLAKPNRKVD